jgi:hypothetical protein
MTSPYERSRITGGLRLALAFWLVIWAVRNLADPQHAVVEQAMPMWALLPASALSFTLGIFLLTGFMSRICGLLLVGMGVWHITSFGVAPLPLVEVVLGAYFALRGGGAWAMDIYVQKMQDKVRQKAVTGPESS